jgi:hypothetical protein
MHIAPADVSNIASHGNLITYTHGTSFVACQDLVMSSPKGDLLLLNKIFNGFRCITLAVLM